MIYPSAYLIIFILGNYVSLKCPPKPVLAWQEEGSSLDLFKCPDLEMLAGINNIKLIINLAKKIETLIKQITNSAMPTSRIEGNSVIIMLPSKADLILELVRLLGLNSLLNNERLDLNNFLPVRLKLLPMAIVQGYTRTSHQEIIQNNALNQYSNLLQIIRKIFSCALDQCQPLGLLNGLLEMIFCCCSDWQSGATGKFAETLRENDLPYNVVSAIGLTFQFFVEECDRQLDNIFRHYNPVFPERIYHRKGTKACFETMALQYGFSWLID